MLKTPEQRWKESIIIHRKKCQKILGISKSIRYVGVINQYGRTLTGMIKSGINPLLGPESAKNEFFIMSNLITLRQSQSMAFGILDSAILKHKNAIILCIPSDKVVYYVSLNPNTKSIDDIARKVKSVI